MSERVEQMAYCHKHTIAGFRDWCLPCHQSELIRASKELEKKDVEIARLRGVLEKIVSGFRNVDQDKFDIRGFAKQALENK